MKKIYILLIVAFLLLIIIAGWYIYRYTLPDMAAKAIVEGKYPVMMPNTIKNKIEIVRDTINQQTDKIISSIDSSGISIDDVMKGIDEINKNDVIKTYKIIAANNITTPTQVFDIAYKNITIDTFDPIIFKEGFLENIQEHHIIQFLAYIEKHDLLESVDFSMTKEIIKKIILNKKKEILSKTELIEFESKPHEKQKTDSVNPL